MNVFQHRYFVFFFFWKQNIYSSRQKYTLHEYCINIFLHSIPFSTEICEVVCHFGPSRVMPSLKIWTNLPHRCNCDESTTVPSGLSVFPTMWASLIVANEGVTQITRFLCARHPFGLQTARTETAYVREQRVLKMEETVYTLLRPAQCGQADLSIVAAISWRIHEPSNFPGMIKHCKRRRGRVALQLERHGAGINQAGKRASGILTPCIEIKLVSLDAKHVSQ